MKINEKRQNVVKKRQTNYGKLYVCGGTGLKVNPGQHMRDPGLRLEITAVNRVGEDLFSHTLIVAK